MFSRVRAAKSTIVWSGDEPTSNDLANAPAIIDSVSGVTVDASCNQTITISCLQQLYNFVGFKPTVVGNSIGLTGYLEQYANLQDLQSFYKDQRPDAINSSYKFFSINGVSVGHIHNFTCQLPSSVKGDLMIRIYPWLVQKLT
jgi:tripeptidyl-peptidase I